MSRKKASETVARLQTSRLFEECRDLRRQCLRWAADHSEELKEAQPETPEQLHDRARDNYEPLIAIAEECGLGDEARAAALTLSGQSPEENEVGTLLLAAIREIFHDQ